MGKTLFDKIWDNHLVTSIDESTNLIFIDLHLVHEVTSPQAFDSLSPNIEQTIGNKRSSFENSN